MGVLLYVLFVFVFFLSLKLQVIHDGLDCKQYQENAKNEEGNTDSHTSKKMLEEMVEKGEAMYCPTCRVCFEDDALCVLLRINGK